MMFTKYSFVLPVMFGEKHDCSMMLTGSIFLVQVRYMYVPDGKCTEVSGMMVGAVDFFSINPRPDLSLTLTCCDPLNTKPSNIISSVIHYK